MEFLGEAGPSLEGDQWATEDGVPVPPKTLSGQRREAQEWLGVKAEITCISGPRGHIHQVQSME